MMEFPSGQAVHLRHADGAVSRMQFLGTKGRIEIEIRSCSERQANADFY